MKPIQASIRLNPNADADGLILEDFEASEYDTLGKYIKHVLFRHAIENLRGSKKKPASRTSSTAQKPKSAQKKSATETIDAPKNEPKYNSADDILSQFKM